MMKLPAVAMLLGDNNNNKSLAKEATCFSTALASELGRIGANLGELYWTVQFVCRTNRMDAAGGRAQRHNSRVKRVGETRRTDCG